MASVNATSLACVFLWLSAVDYILDAAEDYDLFEAFVVSQHTHRVVANVVQFVRVVAVLHANPYLLVQQEKVNVVQKRRDILLAQGIVAATCHNDC